MSYQYGQFIYGFPVMGDGKIQQYMRSLYEDSFEEEGETDLSEERVEALLQEWEEDEPFGIQFMYSAGGDRRESGFLGVALTGEQDLDSCSPFRPRDLVARTPKPTSEQVYQVEQKIQALPPELRKLAEKPEVWIIWGSS
jgi:hypothetical protein